MRVPSWLRTYLHSLVGLTVGMIIILFTLNFLHTRGPGIVAGPAGVLGNLATGRNYNF